MDSVAPALGYAPDRAIRSRLTAIVIDGFLLGILIRVLVPALGADTFAAATFAALALQFLYFFLQEALSGKTVGKRGGRVRVVALDGSAPTIQQLAIRNALRCFDVLPMLYASGLISLMWTGPGQRQRLGDRAAGTTVILEPGGKARTTPGWLLPGLTVVTVLLSVVIYGALYDKYRTPSVSSEALLAPPVPGFAGDNRETPPAGTYTASASLNGQPVMDAATRQQMVGTWRFDKTCPTSGCRYKMTRTVSGAGDESAELTQAPDGWHVAFPTRALKARCRDGAIVTVLRRAAFVLHVDPGGKSIEAHERNLFSSTRCGSFTDALDWSASLAHL
jgi:uncharacterized RDD family membrane protein YckC